MKNLSAVQFEALLVKLGACSEARDWARGKTLREVWKTCKRGDWMLWLAARYGDVPLKTLVAIACDEADPAMAYVPACETRPQGCLAMTRRRLKNEATIEEVKAAKAAAWAAKAAEAAAWAARAAKAAGAAAWAAEVAAGAESLRFSADFCRKYIEVRP